MGSYPSVGLYCKGEGGPFMSVISLSERVISCIEIDSRYNIINGPSTLSENRTRRSKDSYHTYNVRTKILQD